MSQDLYERVANERRRLREVRQSLSAAVAQSSGGDAGWIPYYIAVGDYFETAMARLHRQDIRMGDMLRAKADMQDPEMQRAMQELDERLSGNQIHLQQMLAARDALRANGADALDEFEQAAGAYAEFIVNNMGHHAGTANPARELFSAEDWAYMAEVSEADQQREEQLHEQVFAALPSGVELPEQD